MDEKHFFEKGYFADTNFFKVFSFPLLIGSAENVLKDPNSVTISEKLAKKYFGSIDVVGKTINIRYDKEEIYTISGVFKNITKLASIEFDFILPFSKYKEYRNSNFSWGNHHLMSFVQVKPNSDIQLLGEKITEVYLKNSNWKLPVLFLQPLEEVHLLGSVLPHSGHSSLAMHSMGYCFGDDRVLRSTHTLSRRSGTRSTSR